MIYIYDIYIYYIYNDIPFGKPHMMTPLINHSPWTPPSNLDGTKAVAARLDLELAGRRSRLPGVLAAWRCRRCDQVAVPIPRCRKVSIRVIYRVIYIYIYVCMYMYVYVCICIHIYIYKYSNTWTCNYIHICMCIYIIWHVGMSC